MSRERCDAMFELLAEFALGGLDGAEHAEVMEHVEGCPRCRAELHELAELADRVLTLAPEAEPSRGFGDRVLQAMQADRRRQWSPRWFAAAAAVLLVGIAGVIIGAVGSDSSAPTAARTPTVRTVAMTTEAGAPVGWVNQSGNTPARLQVSVNYALPDGTYTVELLTGPRTRGLGVISVTSGHGSWSGTATVPHDSAAVAMVDASGQTVCSADLPA